ncbi:RsmB/NOP family class I SAM-dependent RNA methyltransferase [Anianabacter salinae]|uniref:RsmB/NOP family class I SAM-dependent RNA methyltransferase n=1 Tax=Anianabacter salinae TaxID=2851023 RepID=UPI00225E5D7A|nr:RsmB/NOP family class I SAM-dependent RNA methyltransferase [Anianabacter salinae]MBV0912096.1 RsmB/NOP family class I SAM-dependent RNA methyltransferase [Anianabacter salinae]
MTPAARIAAAIEIIDRWHAGEPAEKALTTWGRTHRFAGSKDRAAIRDHVFDVLRRARSTAQGGKGNTGRAQMIGLLRQAGIDPAEMFTGEGHAPPPLSPEEIVPPGKASDAESLDWPDWLMPEAQRSLGDDLAPVLEALRHRAPITLRVNAARMGRDTLARHLASGGIETAPNALSPTALDVLSGARGLSQHPAFLQGAFEMQDAASQAVVDLIPVQPGARILDYCAGGGGKTLALAARTGEVVDAHDADPRRMSDLPSRAARADAVIRVQQTDAISTGYDVILMDVPCSGSGAWRRAPEGKWSLDAPRLRTLNDIQDSILDRCAGLLAPGGRLIYATCSLLRCENEDRVDAFLARHPGWSVPLQRRFSVLEGGDGFFTAHLVQHQAAL